MYVVNTIRSKTTPRALPPTRRCKGVTLLQRANSRPDPVRLYMYYYNVWITIIIHIYYVVQ